MNQKNILSQIIVTMNDNPQHDIYVMLLYGRL